MRIRCTVSALVVVLCRTASAQSSDPATAQALFDEAKRLMADGKASDACPKFLASLKLDRAAGAAVNLAECYEKTGQTASAWVRYIEASTLAQQAGQAERAKYARDRAAALEPKLSRMSIVVSKPAADLSITRDGLAVDGAVWGLPTPVDPGKHLVEARAPGKVAWSTTLDVPAGPGVARVDVPTLVAAPEAAPPPSAGPVAPPADTPRAPLLDDAASSRAWSGQRIAGVSLMSASAVGVVLGAVFAEQAHGKYADLASRCPARVACDPSLASDVASYHTASTTSVASFAAGGALLATGMIVFFTSPKAKDKESAFVAPHVGVGTLGVRGGF